MLWMIYILFSGFLYVWTLKSIHYDSAVPRTGYFLGMILLAAFMTVIFITDKRKRIRKGIFIAAVFMNFGLSIGYRCWEGETDPETTPGIFDGYTGDLLLMIAVFLIVFLIVRYTRIYKFRVCNLLLLIVLPVVVYGARISGQKVNGSYLYFAGMMIFGLVLMGFPFAAAYIVSRREDRYMGNKPSVRKLPWNLMGLLLYTFVLYGGCVVCNEFGLLLILGLTTTVLFMIRCKNGVTKLLYTAACAGGALIAGFKISHLSERIQIWMDPVQAYQDAELAEKAESVLYLFRHIYQMGWWGKGIGSLPRSLYPTLNTDHALLTLLNDYSALILIAVLVLGILFVRWLLIQPDGLCVYDQYLNLTCGLIVGFMILVDAASCFGSFITAGIGFPWISEGSSVNIMLTVLMAVHCGLLGKKVKVDDQA